VLLSQTAHDLLPSPVSLADLGLHRLKDLQQPEHVWQLTSPDLVSDFPPLRSLSLYDNNLPQQLTSFISRDRRGCPKVKILVSSREALGISGENAYRVPSLSVPPLPPNAQPEQDAHLASLRKSLGEAAFLFAWEAGGAMSWEEAIACALEEETV
jgi:hypothetical protein